MGKFENDEFIYYQMCQNCGHLSEFEFSSKDRKECNQ